MVASKSFDRRRARLIQPEELIDALLDHLKSALGEIEALAEELSGEPAA